MFAAESPAETVHIQQKTTVNKVKKKICFLGYSRRKVPKHFVQRREKKGVILLTFPSGPLKALRIGLSEALFQPYPRPSINAVDRSVPLPRTTKRAGERSDLFKKKVPLPFFLHRHLLFLRSKLKCMDEVN